MESSLNEDVQLDYSDSSESDQSSPSSPQPPPVAEVESSTTNAASGEIIEQHSTDAESDAPTCAICLLKYQNKSLLDRCFHAFCFACIMTWSNRAKWCPLCKTPFSSIIYNVKSEKIFDQYYFDDQKQKSESSKRERKASPPRVPRPSKAVSAVDRRKNIYARKLYVRPETDARIVVRERDISRAAFGSTGTQLQRIDDWVSREVTALVGEDHHLIVNTYVMSLVQRMDITSPVLATLLRPFFLDNTAQFMHELVNFARSPLDMHAYDRRAQYDDAPVANKLSKEEVRELGKEPKREATPPHMEDYARAIRHMMNFAQKEGQPTEPVSARMTNTPPPIILSESQPDSPSYQFNGSTKQRSSNSRRSRSRSPRRRSTSRSRSPVAHTKKHRHKHDKSDQERHSRRDREKNKGQIRRNASPPRKSPTVLDDDQNQDQSEISPEPAHPAARNASPPIKRKALIATRDLSPSRRPRRERSMSPILQHNSPSIRLASGEEDNVPLMGSSIDEMKRELAEVEATLTRDRQELASILLRRELRSMK